MEQIRCVKELRKTDEQRGRTGVAVRPRYMVWENVPGAFSSNGGEDFRAVLEEAAKIAQPDAVIPRPPKGKWTNSGAIMGDGWSIAWRVHDAQFWGVPQRRRRISVVCDFGGQSAPEILFERKGVSGDSEPGGAQRKEVTGGTGKSTESSVWCLQGNGIDRADTAGCNGKGWREDVCYTLNTIDRPAVYDARGNGDGKTVCTLTGDHQNRVTDYTAIINTYQDVTGTLNPGAHPGSYNGQDAYNDMLIAASLSARDYKGPCAQDLGNNMANYPIQNSVVRRLTPLECERLQGYPDGWTDIGEWVDSKGKRHKDADSPRYKALGNSIALPFWFWLLQRISAQYIGPATLGSLFDGIGGFPLCWERCNGNGTALWASEIEEFPMAVTRRHFGDDEWHDFCPNCGAWMEES